MLEGWKREYHRRPEQIKLQKRDSWLTGGDASGGGDCGGAVQPAAGGRGKGKSGSRKGKGGKGHSGASQPGGKGYGVKGGNSRGASWGPKSKKVQSGKHSRWSKHLQREFGSKALAEVIVFTGRVDAAFLERFATDEPRPYPPSETIKSKRLKLKVERIKAKHALKWAAFLDRGLRRQKTTWEELTPEEKGLVDDFNSGFLRHQLNVATQNHGHGKIVTATGEEVNIGGSSGGKVRRLLDNHRDLDATMVDELVRQRRRLRPQVVQ